MNFTMDDLTRAEKVLIAFLSVLLIGLCYYQFIYRPLTRELERCTDQRGVLTTELAQVQSRLSQLQKMRSELDELGRIGYISRMPSYNSIEEETTFLNDILAATRQYSISFSNPTRNGDQVRRNVSLRFTANGYDTARSVLANLTQNDFRCLLGDLRYAGSESSELSSVSLNATFFETMVSGTIDENLTS